MKLNKMNAILATAMLLSLHLFAEQKNSHKEEHGHFNESTIHALEQAPNGKIAEMKKPDIKFPDQKKPNRRYLDDEFEEEKFSAHFPIYGDWIFRTQTSEVEVEFERDGEMEITVKDGFTKKTKWKGFFKRKDSSVVFSVYLKETETWRDGRKNKSRERVNEEWKISCSSQEGKLILSSREFPKELERRLTLVRDFD